MIRAKWNRMAAALCLVALMTVAAQCSEEEEAVADIAGNIIADVAMTMESTIFPMETEEPPEEPSEEPEPTEVGLVDEQNDVIDFNTGQLASGWGPGLDLSEVIMGVDPESGRVIFRAITPGVEDGEAFLTANPYWGLIVAGDSDPEGTPPLPGMDVFGMGQWHIGCFAYAGALQCELWIREDGQFVQEGEAFNGSFMDGAWMFNFPEGYPPSGHRIGAVVFDPYFHDSVGIEDGVVQFDFIMNW